MNINIYFKDKTKLDEDLKFFEKKQLLKKTDSNISLINAHIDKSKHNMAFFNKNSDDNEFNDWLIVTLYYALYHSALALVTSKNYTSKNHKATLLFLIKHYSITEKEAELINDLSIKKEDAELYTSLKKDRHSASYATNTLFTNEKINEYKIKVIEFIQKTEDILK